MSIKATLATAHKTLTVWFAYLVAASISLQEFGGSLNEYVPPKVRHWVMGVAAVTVVADKIRRSVVKVDPNAAS